MPTAIQEKITASVYATFRAELIGGSIRPGERLGEESLATRWSVGRVPVREALLRLEQEGIVVRKPKVGTFVREIAESELIEVFDLRIALECLVARAVASRASDAQLNEIVRLAQRVDETISVPGEEHAIAHNKFHSALAEYSGLRHATQVLRTTHLLSMCTRYHEALSLLQIVSDRKPHQPDHRAIAAAVHRRDADGAAETMRQHLEAKKRMLVHDLTASRPARGASGRSPQRTL